MANLSTSYMGLPLKNPFIVSSSGLTQSIQGIERSQKAGAGAVVLKSLFEEQIDFELKAEQDLGEVAVHPEAELYIRQMGKQIGPNEYLELIRTSKSRVDIPVIASVNCVSPKWWTNWARQLQDAGADAIELNVALMPRGLDERAEEIEARVLKIVGAVLGEVSLPVAVKLGPYFTSLPRLSAELARRGVKALVLFNRFYQLDIDVTEMELVPGYQFSTSSEIYQSLRWISILQGQIGCELAASTGVHEPADAVKLLLAGANAVQVCSSLYAQGYEHLGTLAKGLSEWMDAKRFESIEQFRGRLSQAASANPEQYERLQYIKALTGVA